MKRLKIRDKHGGNYSHLGLKHTSHTLLYNTQHVPVKEREKKWKLVKTNFLRYVNNLGSALNLESHTREGFNFELTCVFFFFHGWERGHGKKGRQGSRGEEERIEEKKGR